MIYEAIRRLGEQELARPAMSLVWSGLAAGLSMGFSLLARAVLHRYLPASTWRVLITALGYPVGFVMVVLSRQQLFTETTITVVVPLLANPGMAKLRDAARMWAIVLVCNLIGTALFASFAGLTSAVPEGLRLAMLDVSRAAVLHPPLELGMGAIVVGYLMAAMVWLITSAGSSQVAVVSVMTYLIGVGGFAHRGYGRGCHPCHWRRAVLDSHADLFLASGARRQCCRGHLAVCAAFARASHARGSRRHGTAG